jgi:myosin heavy subunit
MCGGGRSSPSPPSLPPAPPPQEMKDFFNEISGTGTITTRNANGKLETRTIRLPRSPRQQAFFDLAEQSLAESLTNIKQLYSYNPAALPSYQPFIDTISNLSGEQVRDVNAVASLEGFDQDVQAFRNLSKQLIADRHAQEKQTLEDSLARRGLSESTLGNAERQQLAAQQSLTAQQTEVNAANYSEELAKKKQDNRVAAYRERQAARENQALVAGTEYNTKLGDFNNKEALRKGAIEEQTHILNRSENAINQDYQRAMGGNTEGNALTRYQADNTIQMAHHQAEQQRQIQNYNMQMQQYQNQAPSFGDTALKMGLIGGASFLGGPGGGMLASQMFGGSNGPQGHALPSNYNGFGDFGANAITSTGLKPGRLYVH